MKMKAMKVLCIVASLSPLICLAAKPSAATLVLSLPTGTVISMPAINYMGTGPQTFGPGITWSSTSVSSNSGFGWTNTYGFGANGLWNGALGPMAGLSGSFTLGSTGTMTFTFSTPVAGVGGFINYTPGGSTPTTIAVYTPGGSLIEETSLVFSTGGGTNTGQFLGFLEPTAEIGSFKLTDNYIGIVNLTAVSAVPLPGALLLFASGLAGLAAMRRRSKK